MPFLPFWGDCLGQTGTSEISPPHLRVATSRGCCEVYHGCRKKCSATDLVGTGSWRTRPSTQACSASRLGSSRSTEPSSPVVHCVVLLVTEGTFDWFPRSGLSG